MSLLALIKGWAGETMGAAAHWVLLDRTIYTSLNNITLQISNGTTQIDHVIVSRFGIFVIEAKNIDGWIFGDEKSAQWSVVRPGRKYRIQNPLRQNYRHVRAIVETLGVDEHKVQSMVMFWGECEFKTAMPANVMREGYATYIKSFSQVVFSDTEVQELIAALRSGAMPKTLGTRQAHLASLDARLGSTTTCPRCGSPLILRTAKTGANAGGKFYGCGGYPRCKYTMAYQGDA